MSSGVGLSGGFWGGTSLLSLGGGSTLGDFIREAQLDDFLYSFGGPQKITASRELPGSTHWDPQPNVSVGGTNGGGGGVSSSLPGDGLPKVGLTWPIITDLIRDWTQGLPEDQRQPPVVFVPPPILLPGQTDPGVEEWESPKEEPTVAGFWDFATSTVDTFFGGPQLGPFDPGMGFSGPTGTSTGAGGAGGPTVPPVAVGLPGCEPPKKWCYDTTTGKYTPYRRRRRRKMLTESDMNQLVQVGTLPNNANVRVALAKRIR